MGPGAGAVARQQVAFRELWEVLVLTGGTVERESKVPLGAAEFTSP